MKTTQTIARLYLRFRVWLRDLAHNRAVEKAARQYDHWSRYAAREGHHFWREHFALLADRERRKKR